MTLALNNNYALATVEFVHSFPRYGLILITTDDNIGFYTNESVAIC